MNYTTASTDICAQEDVFARCGREVMGGVQRKLGRFEETLAVGNDLLRLVEAAGDDASENSEIGTANQTRQRAAERTHAAQVNLGRYVAERGIDPGFAAQAFILASIGLHGAQFVKESLAHFAVIKAVTA